MCFFSDAEKRAPMRGQKMTAEQINGMADTLLKRCLKMQIGCSAEPTLYAEIPALVKKAKEYGVPYVSMTSNGQLLDEDSLTKAIEAGLDELTLSMHGMKKETYEYLMNGAKWERLKSLIGILKSIKINYPDFKIRINYVVNDMNTLEIANFWHLLDGLKIDIIQFRPVQPLGDTDYSNFDLSKLKTEYNRLIKPILARCKEEGVTCIAPTLSDLDKVNDTAPWISQRVEDLTYYYISATGSNHPELEMKPGNTTGFNRYHKQQHTIKKLLKDIFRLNRIPGVKVSNTKKLNYHIK
jgi:hypothetical protein